MMETAVTTHWNDVAHEYDRLMYKDRSYQEQLNHIVGAIEGSPSRILDLGCGTGALLRKVAVRFPNASFVGLDPAEDMLNKARESLQSDYDVTCVLGSAHQLDFPDASFDYVISNWALHHLSHGDKLQCAKEVFRVLKPGGKFINGDQFAEVMGPINDKVRIQHILELLSNKAKYYLEEVSFERMLLQVKLMPKFLLEDGEILATPEFWIQVLEQVGFTNTSIIISEPAYMLNRVVVGEKE